VFGDFQARATRAPIDTSVFLVSTSAGEVGVNLDADHLVCDLSTLDSMIQRFGRVNRLGRDSRDFVARIDVLATSARTSGKDGTDEHGAERAKKYAAALGKTSEKLAGLPRRGRDSRDGLDASPATSAREKPRGSSRRRSPRRATRRPSKRSLCRPSPSSTAQPLQRATWRPSICTVARASTSLSPFP